MCAAPAWRRNYFLALRISNRRKDIFHLKIIFPAEGGKEFPVLHQILQLPQLFSSSHWRQKLLIHSRHASVYPILPILPRNLFAAASDRMKKVDICYSSSSFHSLEKVFTCTNALGGQHARDTASHRRRTWNLQKSTLPSHLRSQGVQNQVIRILQLTEVAVRPNRY